MSTNIVAGSVSTDYETAASHTITVRETLAGASNSPRDTVLTINVTDVADTSSWTPLNLGAKLLAYGSVALSVTRTGTDITAVPDLSGNGYHFAASGNPQYGAASYNGGPGATFDGIDD